MTPARRFVALAASAAATVAALSGPAAAQTRYDGDDAARGYGLVGPGAPLLDRELRDTPRGRAFVLREFDFNHDGVVQPREAREANRAFRDGRSLGEDDRGYGRRRDRDDRSYDRDERSDDRDDRRRYDDRRDEAPPPPPPPERGGYADDDRPAMRAYGFRQNRYGAVFTLQDVLFETGSARLRPQADAKLRPLAGYLRRNPGQRLRIDGYTDSVGTARANLILSQDRARAVADALSALGVDAGRFQLEGHGEDSPVASNTGADGRQQNRRVEVTLVGRQASSFD